MFALILVLEALHLPAFADTAWISAGGAVHQLTKNENISMQSEVVKIHITPHLVRVSCRFIFVNDGPACSVRMGFPDYMTMPLSDTRKTLRAGFLSYASYVDNKKVKTR
jgi:hypothetical protein